MLFNFSNSRLPRQLVDGVVVVEPCEGVQSSGAPQGPTCWVGDGINEFADSLMDESHGTPVTQKA